MKTHELRTALEKLSEAAPGGRGSIKPSIAKIIGFLDASVAYTVDDIVVELRKAANPTVVKKAPIVLRDHVVARHVKALRSAGTQIELFENALAALRTDKQVRVKPELKSIANQYEGSDRSYSKKDDAYAVIEERFRQLAVSDYHARGPKTSAAG